MRWTVLTVKRAQITMESQQKHIPGAYYSTGELVPWDENMTNGANGNGEEVTSPM